MTSGPLNDRTWFFLHEAAAYWNGCEPPADEHHYPENCPNYIATKEMLTAEMRLGDLPSSYEPVPGSRHPLICQPMFLRADLLALARRMGKRPLFLFPPVSPEDASNNLEYLIKLMSQSPERNDRPKDVIREEAMKRIGISARRFDSDWIIAIKQTGATGWSKAGAKRRRVAVAAPFCPATNSRNRRAY